MKLNNITNNIKFIKPSASSEIDEIQRYQLYSDISIDEFQHMIDNGTVISPSERFLKSLDNSTAADFGTANDEYNNLESDKIDRVERIMKRGVVELPLVIKDGVGYSLVSGNTRLTYLVKTKNPVKILILRDLNGGNDRI